MTISITTRQAQIVASYAVEFMAEKAGMTTAQILDALASGHAATVSYFVELLEIGGREANNLNA